MRGIRWLQKTPFVGLVATGVLASCVTFHKADLVRVADKRLTLEKVDFLASDQHVRILAVSTTERPVATYYVETANPRGVLFAMGGNGNQVAPMLRTLSRRAEALHLNLVLYSYYVRGQAPPTTAETEAESQAVFDAVAKLGTPESQKVYVLGHSYGCWFATELASHAPVKGLILASAGTSIAETFGDEYFPLNLIVRFGADDDVARVDAVRDAREVHMPTLVFSSDGDGVIRSPLTRRVFDALPTDTRKEMVVLKHVSHLGYLDDDQFWSRVSDFFNLGGEPGLQPSG